MSLPLLDVVNLRVNYGGVVAVDGISLTVGEGEVVAVIGANGAGKSSTLMALSGVVRAAGEITFHGERIDRLPPVERVRRGIAQVPEGRRIFSRLSVRENLLLGAFPRRDKTAVKRDLDEALTLFPILKERLSQTGGTLSGGEQQMLALARGLMAAPKLLLLDEPSLGLSPIFAKKIFSVIGKLSKEGRSILLVEQNARSALNISHRTYCLETGKVVAAGDSPAIAQDPKVKAAYLGTEL